MNDSEFPKKQCVSPNVVLRMLKSIVADIVDSGKTYTHVMGVSRGGLVPAVYISHLMNLPLAVTAYSAPEGKGDGTHNRFTWQDDKHCEIEPSSRVLVVDDIVDSGLTMSHIIEELNVYSGMVDYATLFEKDGSVKPEGNFETAGYIGEFLKEDGPWIVFPWEETDRRQF